MLKATSDDTESFILENFWLEIFNSEVKRK
jgi:hypothetical protein